MRILFCGSEATPFVKTGGLADVLGSLPQAVSKLGHEVSLVLPKHKAIKAKYQDQLTLVATRQVRIQKKHEYVGIEKLEHEGVTVYFIDNEYYFGYRDHLYGDYDDGERYGYFSQAIYALIQVLDYAFDVIHLNDWQTGFLPHLLNVANDDKLHDIKTVFTIHNIAYQGIFDKSLLPYLSVPYHANLEYDNMINFLKTGIVSADYITTVSPTYAKEIQYAYFGYGMEGLLRERKDRLTGILNGIDTDSFNPKTDPDIAQNYHLQNYLKGKKANKEALLETFHLEPNDKPIFAIVSRLTEQKGLTLLKGFIESFLYHQALRLIVLGSGDEALETFFEDLRRRYPNQVGVYFGYSDKIARRLYAGADFFLMPSRFEPCGLSQLIALRYGTIPVVRQTGGLKDSIQSYNKFTVEGTGIGFMNFSAEDLERSMHEAIDLYHHPKNMNKVRRRAMQEDFSWEQSAKTYVQLYTSLGGR